MKCSGGIALQRIRISSLVGRLLLEHAMSTGNNFSLSLSSLSMSVSVSVSVSLFSDEVVDDEVLLAIVCYVFGGILFIK